MTLEKCSFRVAGVTAQLKGGQTVKVVVSRAFAKKMKAGAGIRAYTYRYFVCSDPALAVATICEFYSVRWEIETFHALAKELLGLDHLQCWRERNVKRWWRLVLIAYTYLVLEAVEQNSEYAKAGESRVSLGQVVAQHRREAHRAQAEWVYAQAKAGQALAVILEAIAA